MNNEIDNLFLDVRNAFRLLNEFQERVLQIVTYLREQTSFNDMWGSKSWYSNEIGSRRDSPDSDYAKLSVRKDMWGWDFLYGYIFEFYFGCQVISGKNVEMSVFQISDDGYFISQQDEKQMTNISSFEESERSHSYFLLNVAVYSGEDCEVWLRDAPGGDCREFLTNFLSSSESDKIIRNKKGDVSIVKKCEMQLFTSQSATDRVLRDYGRLVKDESGIEIFKKSFYENID